MPASALPVQMNATQAPVAPVHQSFVKVKMDERKRSLASDPDELQPRKRTVKDENGQQMRMDAEKEKDIEAFQKDAVLRQMKEYKREKKHYEDLYLDLNKKLTHHDDHLRTIDAWFAQLLDELRVLATDALPTPPPSATSDTGDLFKSSLGFADHETFSIQLQARSAKIKEAISSIFSRIPSASPDVRILQEQISKALANEKVTIAECQRLNSEKEQLTERLEAASWRYMKAEKALDRAKSLQIQKLERQAYMGWNGESSSPNAGKKAGTPVKREHSETNGELENGVASAESETARREAMAVADTRKKQLDELEIENARLTNELSAARTKVASLTDDDFAETALFKSIKGKYEDVIKRVNDFEATNGQLREDAQKLQSERTSYRLQVDEEVRAHTADAEAQIARCEVDLARIRNLRDELTAEISIRKAAEDSRRTAADQAKELAEARDRKIASLESEVARLKLQLGEMPATASAELVDGLDVDGLKARLRTLELQHTLLSQELPSMEDAWRKAQALSSKRIADLAESEEKLSRFSAEKAKAEQKYFAAMKAKDARESELRILKAKDARSSEIVSQLKEADGRTRELVVALERQLAEAKDVLGATERQFRVSEQKQAGDQTMVDGVRKQVDELKGLVSGKDKEMLAATKAKREAEDALESCKARLDETKKQFDTYRKTRAVQADTDSDDWRKVAICPVCNANIRNTVLKLCGHVFCHSCVKDLISNRSRKCPSCGKNFGTNDHMPIVLT